MEEAEAEGEAAAGLQYGLLAQRAVAARRAAREHPWLEAGAVERVGARKRRAEPVLLEALETDGAAAARDRHGGGGGRGGASGRGGAAGSRPGEAFSA